MSFVQVPATENVSGISIVVSTVTGREAGVEAVGERAEPLERRDARRTCTSPLTSCLTFER